MTLDMPSLFSVFKSSSVLGEGLGSDDNQSQINQSTQNTIEFGLMNNLTPILVGDGITDEENMNNGDFDTFGTISRTSKYSGTSATELKWDFGESFLAKFITYNFIYTSTIGSSAMGFAHVKLQVSNDDATWTDIVSFTEFAGGANCSYINMYDHFTEKTRYVRFTLDITEHGGSGPKTAAIQVNLIQLNY